MHIFGIIRGKEINIYKISRSILSREEETLSYSERKMIDQRGIRAGGAQGHDRYAWRSHQPDG